MSTRYLASYTSKGTDVPTNAAGDFSAALVGVSFAGQVAVANPGSLASMLAATSMSASGLVAAIPAGSFAAMLGSVAMAAGGNALNAGSLAATMGAASMTAAGAASPHAAGTLASTLAGTTMSGSGYLGATPPALPVRPYRWRVLRRHFTHTD
jgi:hypothetical protein